MAAMDQRPERIFDAQSRPGVWRRRGCSGLRTIGGLGPSRLKPSVGGRRFRAGRSLGRNKPASRIERFAAHPEFEIQSVGYFVVHLPDGGDDFPRIHLFASLFMQFRIVSIQRHVAIAVIDDYELTKVPKPIREYDASDGDGCDFRTCFRLDEHP